MADNVAVTPGSGATIRSRDLGEDSGTSGVEAQGIMVRGWPPIVKGTDVAISVGGSVVKSGSGLTIPSGTTHVLVSVEAGDVRYREDNTAPTSTGGILLTSGTLIELAIPVSGTTLEPTYLQFIEASTSGGAATLNLSYRQYV